VLALGDQFREGLPGLDLDRALRLAVVHDVAEAETGDAATRADSTADSVDAAAKEAAERAAMEDLAGALPDRIRDAWEDYEARESPEAILVKECDLLDVCLQAVLYERGGRYDPPAATRERSASTTTSTNSSRRPNPAFKPRPVGGCSPGSASGTGPLATSRSPSGPSVRVASSTTVVELQNDDCRDSTAGSAAKIARTLTTEPVLKSESFHHACPRTLI